MKLFRVEIRFADDVDHTNHVVWFVYAEHYGHASVKASSRLYNEYSCVEDVTCLIEELCVADEVMQ